MKQGEPLRGSTETNPCVEGRPRGPGGPRVGYTDPLFSVSFSNREVLDRD